MSRFRLALLVGLLLWGGLGRDARAQNRTELSLRFDGDPELRDRMETRATRLLTEVNRASYFDERPDLAGMGLTAAARSAVRTYWAEAAFRCPRTDLSRPLREGRARGTYEVQDIPLLVERPSGTTRERSGILVFDAEGRIEDVLYRAERTETPERGSIAIRTEPPGARVVSAIGGGTRTTAPAQFQKVPANAYAFTIRKEGYRDIVDTTLVVRARETVEHTIRLSPRRGRIAVTPASEGTTVRVDGDTVAAPRRGVAVAPGAHRVVVSKPNYARWDTTLTVTAADTATVTPRLARTRVPFVARSAPPGATVLANGRALGATPLDTTVRAGRAYTIRFEKAGHIPSPRTRLVAPQQGAVDRRVVLVPVETDVEAKGVRIEDLTIRRTGGAVDLRYALLGASGERYRVDVAVVGPGGTRQPVPADSVAGAVGAGLRPGGDKRILLRSAIPEGSTVRLSVRRRESDHTLLYIAGGAVVAGGALAALIFGGGSGGGGSGSSFPQPPGLPQ